MTSAAETALPSALALLRSPRSARPGVDEPLPDDMLRLLRIAAGEEASIVTAQQESGESAEQVREAATFYIQQVMFATGNDSYRTLGVNDGASEERLREHYRWLVRWLHPDRNPDAWEAVYSERVNQAWQDLRTEARRLRYDQERSDRASIIPESRPTVAIPRTWDYASPTQPGPNLRWLPKAIFGALGASAILIVVVFSLLRWAGPRSADVASEAQAPRSVASEAEAPRSVASAIAYEQPSHPPVEVPRVIALAPSEPPRPELEFADAVSRPLERSTRPEPAKPAVNEAAAPATAAHVPAVASPIPALLSPKPARVARNGPPPPGWLLPPNAPASVARQPVQAALDPTLASPPVRVALAVDEHAANRVLGRFSQAYSEGNLGEMRAMFTRDARSSAGGLDAILADYARVFAQSDHRTLAVRDVSWFSNGATFTIIASYQATIITGRAGRPRKTQGDLRLDLRRDQEQWRIYRLQHGERRG